MNCSFCFSGFSSSRAWESSAYAAGAGEGPSHGRQGREATLPLTPRVPWPRSINRQLTAEVGVVCDQKVETRTVLRQPTESVKDRFLLVYPRCARIYLSDRNAQYRKVARTCVVNWLCILANIFRFRPTCSRTIRSKICLGGTWSPDTSDSVTSVSFGGITFSDRLLNAWILIPLLRAASCMQSV